MRSITGILKDFFYPVGMIVRSSARKYYTYLLFLIIPVTFMIGSRAIHNNRGEFFMCNTDPEYFFLYNGALIGGGNLSVDYTSNPGTPLMVLIAVSSRMVSLFQPGNYYEDIANDPEKYIHAANLLLVFLISLTLFAAGWYVWQATGSLIAGLLFQMTLPGSASLMLLSSHLKAEVMAILPVLLLCLVVYRYVFSGQDREYASNTTLVVFGLIGGFGMACKLILIPLVIIPFILLKSTPWQKVKLLIYTLLSFALFAYPIVFNNGDFWGWVSGIFSHTGKYGAGQKGFIDMASVPGNLSRLYMEDRPFIFITGMSLISGIVTLFISHRSGLEVQKRLGLALIAVSLAIISCIALVLKHFEVYYFFPVYTLKFFMVSLIFLLVIRINKIGSSGLIKSIVTVMLLFPIIYMSYLEIGEIKSNNRYIIAGKIHLQAKHRKVMSLMEQGSPVILSARFSGAPLPEFANYEGFKMSFKLRKSFIPYLKARFPVSYQYVWWDSKFYFWDSFVDFKTILDNTPRSFYVFIGEKKSEDLAVIEERIWSVVDRSSLVRELVYEDPAIGEQLIKYTRVNQVPKIY